MSSAIRRVYEEYLQLDNDDDCYDYIFTHPVLFSPAHMELSRTLLSLQQVDENMYRAYNYLIFVYDVISKNQNPYPIGVGPIEPVYFSCDHGEISLTTACKKVQQTETCILLAPLYVTRLCVYADNLLLQSARSWKSVDKLLTIMLAAVEAIPEQERIEQEWSDMWCRVIISTLEMTTMKLIQVPDKRILNKVVNLGKRALEYIRIHGEEHHVGKLLQRLGVLHLDPWFVGKTSINYMPQFWAWQRKVYSSSVLTSANASDIEMLHPKDALEAAKGYLTKAIDKQESLEKALSIKALSETLMWRHILDIDKDKDELIQTAEKGMRLMEALDYSDKPYTVLQNIVAVYRNQSQTEREKTSSVSNKLEREPLDKLIGEFGQLELLDKLKQNIQLIVKHEPEKALVLWQKAQILIDDSGWEEQIASHCVAGLQIIQMLFKVDDILVYLRSKSTIERYNEILDNAKQLNENLTPETYATLLFVAYTSSGRDEEEEGISILSHIAENVFEYPELSPFKRMNSYMTAELWQNTAVNMMKKNDLTKALEKYITSLNHFLHIGHIQKAHNLLQRIEDIISTPTFIDIDTAIGCISYVALQVEKLNDLGLSSVCQSIYKILLQRMPAENINPTAYTFLIQLIKGYAFNSTLQSTISSNILHSRKPEGVIKKIEELSQSIVGALSSRDNYFLEGERLLLSYAGTGTPWDGDDPEVRLQNLKIILDKYIYNKLIPETNNSQQYLLAPEQLKELLPSNTVLLIQLMGPSVDGMASLYNIMFTREEIRVVLGKMQDIPSMVIEMSLGDKTVHAPVLSFTIEETRTAILDEPETTGLTRKAKAIIQSNAHFFLGGDTLRILEDFRKQGKDHICVWPHGPLHFFPFHLLPVNDEPICNSWKVSYIPSIGILTKRATGRNAVKDIKHQLSSMGINFTDNNPYEYLQLSKLDNSVREASRIAETCNGNLILEQDVTEEAFIEAMRTSKWVHLATHGMLDASAPSFQCLLLHKGPNSDGVLNAYELIDNRFDHVDLLTLSACQTALGRFDYSDNIRGMPAILMQCGVKTIIGTLWESEVESSELFFFTLYKELNKGSGKLVAFTIAQQVVKEHFPDYRDWGVFYYTGEF